MGVLDDAIREHLELKRKHGVPEEELQREEEEALGPARRDVAQRPENPEPDAVSIGAEDGEPMAPAADQDTALFDMEAGGDADAEPPPERPEPPAEQRAAEDVRERSEPGDEQLLSADEEAAAEEGDPDVLEDTPDFLQETPEHDRLWFEQKPPRDFDFD